MWFMTEREHNYKVTYFLAKGLLKNEENGESLYLMVKEIIETVEKEYPKIKQEYREIELDDVIRKFEVMK